MRKADEDNNDEEDDDDEDDEGYEMIRRTMMISDETREGEWEQDRRGRTMEMRSVDGEELSAASGPDGWPSPRFHPPVHPQPHYPGSSQPSNPGPARERVEGGGMGIAPVGFAWSSREFLWGPS